MSSICNQVRTHRPLYFILIGIENSVNSTNRHLILSLQDMSSTLDQGEHADVILLDFSEAFEVVPHQRPLKSHSYNTLIRPILEYAYAVWDPHTATYQLEAVQRRAARFVKGENRTTSSTNAMTAALGWPTLLYCRSNTNLFMLYTITHDLKVIPAAQFSHS